ncbi:Peroxiredoxin HYR1 [Candida viswanathii]|uniref:Peroxiredoxin HYR1 n=1 Tax=Candida viswanathii TaxID=5486 RepID=A0A367XT75_9ASCO|nr:Peroxiredoxin HYR1 [Candida viswanathii]
MDSNDTPQPRIYSFKLPDANNNLVNFSQFAGKVIIVVNVATLCVPRAGSDIIGFPCNQFGNQEPFMEDEIVQFCHSRFGVTFPIMKKIKVNGEPQDQEVSELYRYLKDEKRGHWGSRACGGISKSLL